MQRHVIAGTLACAIAAACAAEPTTFDLGTLVVTPARQPHTAAASLADLTVVSAADLRRMGIASLPQALQASGVLELRSNGGPGQNASVFLRGANASHTVVLIDGVRLYNITDGTTALEQIPLDQIERIEILRGPASSLYGADAIGGVIQIFTRGATRDGMHANIGYGSYGSEQVGIGGSFGSPTTRVQIQGGYQYSQAYSATNSAAGFLHNPDRDPYRNTSLTAKLSHALSEGHTLNASVFQSRSTTHFDGGAGSDDIEDQTLSLYSVQSRNRLRANWLSTLTLAHGVDDYRFYNTAFPSWTRSTQDQITWQHDVTTMAGGIVLGAEYTRQRLASDIAYDQTRRTIGSAFAVYRGELDAHSLQASARFDDNSQFGGHTSASLGYGYQLAPAWRFSANGGTAYKAPTFADLYYPGFSNPDLQPERGRSWDAALRYAQGHARAGVLYFENRIDDLIVFDFGPMKPVNVARARIRGIELSGAAGIGAFDLRANLTLQDPVNAETGKQLQSRARVFGSLAASWQRGPWSASAETVGSGARYASNDANPATRMGGYALFNLGLGYAIDKRWSIQARWNNVFDKNYALARGYNTAGSSAFVSLRYVAP